MTVDFCLVRTLRAHRSTLTRPVLMAGGKFRVSPPPGVSPAQIFRAATLANAQALGLDQQIGTVQVGKRANLLLLRDDPSQTIEAYAHIVKVIPGGRLLDPADLAADRHDLSGRWHTSS
jgi:adenine deaminase